VPDFRGTNPPASPRDAERRLRVAYVYRDFQHEGSIPRIFTDRSERLSRDEDVTVVCSATTRSATDAPLDFETVEPLVRGRGRFRYAIETGTFAVRAWRTVRHLRREVDVVHSVGFATPEADLVTVNAVRPAEIAHYFDHIEPEAWLRRRLTPFLRPQSLVVLAIERRLFRPPFPYCITHSEAIARDLMNHYGVPREAVEAVPVGVDVRRFAGVETGAELRARLGTPQERLVVLFVGEDFERKGLDRAIQAVGRLRVDAELWVAGAGPRAQYEALAGSLPASQQVRFFGHVPHDELPTMYAAANAVLLPSRQDSWGHSVLEGFAAGAVVLVSEFTGAHEVVHDGVDGFVLEREGPPEQAAAILDSLAAASSARAKVGEHARETAARYDRDLLYERFRAAHHKAYERRLAHLRAEACPVRAAA
jgi:glycosyltransferase involved in cell wall biosynthesis